MKKQQSPKLRAAPTPPSTASNLGKPVKSAGKPTARRSALIEARKMPLVKQLTSRAKALPVRPSAKKTILKPAKKLAAPVARKRAPQHDSAYYATIGKRGGKSLAQQRGPEFFAEIARLSHPRAVYNGGRPKGSTKAKKLKQEAAAKKNLAKKKK